MRQATGRDGVRGHDVELLQGGDELFPVLCAAIDAAAVEVRLETYIFSNDAAAARVLHSLIAAARRGVAVFLLVDGVGTPELPQDWVAGLAAAGVHWRRYRPPGRLGWLLPSRWRRLHRKLCVVDGRWAFCGGINIVDDGLDPGLGRLPAPRFDFAVRVQGPLVQEAREVMARTWWLEVAEREARGADWRAAWQALQALQAAMPVPSSGVTTGRMQAALLLRDNLQHRRRIERAYLRAIGQAHTEVFIANAYFLPGRALRQALVAAARRGVRVVLLLQGRYEYFMQYHAVRPVYRTLLAAGIEIHEYAPSFLHAKVAVVDGIWATVGSSNLDPLSLLLAREANVVVEDAGFAQALRARLQQAMAQGGVRVDPAEQGRRPLRERMLDRLAFSLMRLALFLTGRRY